MLAGQVITLLNSIVIGLTGVLVVMIELGLLALLVIGLSKSIRKLNFLFEMYELGKKSLNNKEEKVIEQTSNNLLNEILEEEIAIIATTICEETNLKPEDFIITSIIKK